MTRATHIPRRKAGASPQRLISRAAQTGDTWGPWVPQDSFGDADDPRRGAIATYHNRVLSVQEIRRNGLHLLTVVSRVPRYVPTWQDLVRVKDELVGTERQAAQVYPRRSEYMDQGGTAQLWIVPEGDELPFTFAKLHAQRGGPVPVPDPEAQDPQIEDTHDDEEPAADDDSAQDVGGDEPDQAG